MHTKCWHCDTKTTLCYTSTNDLKKPIDLFFKIDVYYKLFMRYYFLMKTVMKLLPEIKEGLLMHSNLWKYIHKRSCYKFPINKAWGLGFLRFCSLTKPQKKFTHLFGEPFWNSTSPQYTLCNIIPSSRESK
jgi:hypothetical protein